MTNALLTLGAPPADLSPRQLTSWVELGTLLPVGPRLREKFITAVRLHAATREAIEELARARTVPRPSRAR